MSETTITLYQRQRTYKISTIRLKQTVRSFLQRKKVRCSEVIIHIVSAKTIRELHSQFFNDPSITDCISLPIDAPSDDSPYSVLGEVFVCAQVAYDYAATHEKDPEEEIVLYTIHGLLHLLGYDDITPEQKKIMRQEEKKSLQIDYHSKCRK